MLCEDVVQCVVVFRVRKDATVVYRAVSVSCGLPAACSGVRSSFQAHYIHLYKPLHKEGISSGANSLVAENRRKKLRGPPRLQVARDFNLCISLPGMLARF